MRNGLYILLVTLIAFGCGAEEEQLMNVDEVSTPVMEVEDISELAAPEITCLYQYFSLDLKDESFETYYYQLISDLRNQDTVAMVNAFAEAVGFSKYECWDGHWVKDPACNGCTKCSREGIIKGAFGTGPKKDICASLERLISCFGIGEMPDDGYYSNLVKGEVSYANFNFKSPKQQEAFFDYRLTLYLGDSVDVYAEADTNTLIRRIPAEAVERQLDVGEEIQGKQRHIWFRPFEHNGLRGYTKSNESFTNFGHTRIVFSRIKGEWKITHVFQPPGC